MAEVAREVMRTGGVRSFYKGVAPAMVSAIPFGGISMTTFMQGKQLYKDACGMGPLETPPVPVMLLLSSLATFNAQLVSYPLFCIKANMQVSDGQASVLATGRRMVRAKGALRGLYGGLSMNVLKAFPAVSISFVVYSKAKSTLGLP